MSAPVPLAMMVALEAGTLKCHCGAHAKAIAVRRADLVRPTCCLGTAVEYGWTLIYPTTRRVDGAL